MAYRARRLFRTLPSSLLGKMLALCAVAAIGVFGITEFTDFQSRHLVTFTQAVSAIHDSPEANHLLGSPIRVSWPVKASGNLSNEPGKTHLLIPVSGTLGVGQLVADGLSIAGAWKLTNLQLVQNGNVTTLLSAPATP
jgi:hypothetical protein